VTFARRASALNAVTVSASLLQAFRQRDPQPQVYAVERRKRTASHFPWKRKPVVGQTNARSRACGSTGGGANTQETAQRARGLGIRDKQVLVVNKAICACFEASFGSPMIIVHLLRLL
jgi:hypothetical protein